MFEKSKPSKRSEEVATRDVLKKFANLIGIHLSKCQILKIFKSTYFEEYLLTNALSSGFYSCCDKQFFNHLNKTTVIRLQSLTKTM